jgi:hypothetical protein
MAYFYADKKGNMLGNNFWKLDGSLSQEEYINATKKGIPFSGVIPIKADDQILKIVIYDETSGRMASKFTKKKGKGLGIDPHPFCNQADLCN